MRMPPARWISNCKSTALQRVSSQRMCRHVHYPGLEAALRCTKHPAGAPQSPVQRTLEAGQEDAARAALQHAHGQRWDADAHQRSNGAQQGRAHGGAPGGHGPPGERPRGAHARQRAQRQRAVEHL